MNFIIAKLYCKDGVTNSIKTLQMLQISLNIKNLAEKQGGFNQKQTKLNGLNLLNLQPYDAIKRI